MAVGLNYQTIHGKWNDRDDNSMVVKIGRVPNEEVKIVIKDDNQVERFHCARGMLILPLCENVDYIRWERERRCTSLGGNLKIYVILNERQITIIT